jgi:hypothetical protein
MLQTAASLTTASSVGNQRRGFVAAQDRAALSDGRGNMLFCAVNRIFRCCPFFGRSTTHFRREEATS